MLPNSNQPDQPACTVSNAPEVLAQLEQKMQQTATAKAAEQAPRQARSTKQLLTILPPAIEQIRLLLNQRGKPSVGVRVNVRARGCSGLSYTLEYADEQRDTDEIVKQDDVTLLIDKKAVLFVIGTEMDFVAEQLASGFVFKNPNEKGRCGCGASFHV